MNENIARISSMVQAVMGNENLERHEHPGQALGR